MPTPTPNSFQLHSGMDMTPGGSRPFAGAHQSNSGMMGMLSGAEENGLPLSATGPSGGGGGEGAMAPPSMLGPSLVGNGNGWTGGQGEDLQINDLGGLDFSFESFIDFKEDEGALT